MADPRLELDPDAGGARLVAELLAGRGTNGGVSLVVDGTTQSHVNLDDPLDLQLEYTRLIAALVDGCREPGHPLRVLHLGAGALTVARYLAATRPGSAQHVVELHRELLEFVLAALPLRDDVELTAEFGDARAAVERAAKVGAGYDLVLVDVFSGSRAPRHLSTAEFFAALERLTAADGLVVVNTLAAPGLRTAREVAATLGSVFDDVFAVTAAEVVDGASLGNVVLVASAAPLPGEQVLRLADAGPRPVVMLRDSSLAEFIDAAPVRRDADPLD
ncbi:spermidine synthase [Agromyces sp. 3263]|uniref:spermidine synthase n=1 Tax=Agromyces sp. 3263 TaxID=2817750 RepID=UPI00285D7223|nr:fused MFS/spermidine synthase [Agromyces sp. 3263]MDR6907615.1 spermidine synthase [Agromyces sp. 3263]